MVKLAWSWLLVAFLATLPGLVHAHGPTRQKVTESVEIAAPPDKVWAVIANFHDFSWHPAIEKTEGSGGNEKDAMRTLVLKDGKGTIEEKLSAYDAAKMSYSYRIEKVDIKVLPVSNYSSTITVEPAGDGKSKVEWKGAFYRGYPNNDPPPDQTDEASVKAVSGIYKAGLDALKAKFSGGA